MRKNIVFIMTSTCFWDAFVSVYNAFKSDCNYNVYILTNDTNFFKQKNIVSISYHNFDVSTLSPDIIFRDTPYCSYAPENIQGITLSNIVGSPKICHIPYGMLLGVVEETYFANHFFRMCWKIFIDSEEKKSLFKRFYDNSTLDEKFVVSGYPKHDFYINADLVNTKIDKNIDYNKTIIWAPHWSVSHYNFNDADKYNYERGYSNFLPYKDLFLRILEEQPLLKIILRPHPVLFKRLEILGHMSKSDIEEYKNKFNSFNNGYVMEGGDYMEQFINSDALITDCSSFLGEYLPSRKPVLHLTREDSPGFNHIGEKIIRSYYSAENESQIMGFINNVVIDEQDKMKKDREKAIVETLYINKQGAGNFIKKYIDSKLRFNAKTAHTNKKEITIDSSFLKRIISLNIRKITDIKCSKKNIDFFSNIYDFDYTGIDDSLENITNLKNLYYNLPNIKLGAANFLKSRMAYSDAVTIFTPLSRNTDEFIHAFKNLSYTSNYIIAWEDAIFNIKGFLPPSFLNFKDKNNNSFLIYKSDDTAIFPNKTIYNIDNEIIEAVTDILFKFQSNLDNNENTINSFLKSLYNENELSWKNPSSMLLDGKIYNEGGEIAVNLGKTLYRLVFKVNREDIIAEIPKCANYNSTDISDATKDIIFNFIKRKDILSK